MADPLSITASIIAVVGAAEGVTKTLSKIKNLRNAPDELLALINEISDLKLILNDVQSYVARNTQRPQISQEELSNMSTLVNRAKDKLLELEKFIQYKLVKPDSISDQIKVSRREWIRAKNTIEKFQQSLRDIRLNNVTHMVVINSWSRIGLTIDEIHLISSHLQTNQLRSDDRTSHQLDEHSRLLNRLLSGQSNLQGLLELQNASGWPTQQATDPLLTLSGNESTDPIIRIRAYASQHQRSPCTAYCMCACHNVQAFRSPTLLHEVIGTLFIGYSGNPTRTLRRCTEASCISQSTFRTYVHYVFPSWFLIKALTMALMSVFLGEISVSLTVRPIVPNGADILRFVTLDDVEGIKRLFSTGMASPNDSLEDGQTFLLSAIYQRKLSCSKFLLAAGANPHLEIFGEGMSAFDSAWDIIFQGSDNSFVLENLPGLFPDSRGLLKARRFSKLHKMILGILPCDIKEEVRTCGPAIDSVDANGFTALMWAARRGDSIAVDLLIKAGADINLENNLKKSALLYAAIGANLTCVKLLLEANADHLQVDSLRYNALHFAAQYSNRRDIIGCLVESSVDMEARTIWGSTPLIQSTYINQVISATTLLDYGADINAIDNDGDNALYSAIHYYHDDMTQILFQRGTACNQINKIGNSILHPLAASGGLRTLNILFAAELEDIDTEAVNNDVKTAFKIAQERADKPDGFVEKFEELLVDIRARNAELERTRRRNSSIGESSRAFRQFKLVRLAWARLSWIRLINWRAHFRLQMINHLQLIHHRRWKNTWSTIWRNLSLYWIIVLLLAVIMYPYLGTSLDITKQILILVWDLAGPGEMVEV